MIHLVRQMDVITRQDVRKYPSATFLFGDNVLCRGFGGQAKEMRGEPNAIGIPTKKAPSMNPGAFFTDDEYDENIAVIDRAFRRIPENASMLVVPSAGIGTGLAQLEQRAPRTFAYLQGRLRKLRETGEL